jgi:hypothetical protein
MSYAYNVDLQRAEDPGDRAAAAGAIYPLLTAAVRHQPRDISLTAASTLATVEQTGPRPRLRTGTAGVGPADTASPARSGSAWPPGTGNL